MLRSGTISFLCLVATAAVAQPLPTQKETRDGTHQRRHGTRRISTRRQLSAWLVSKAYPAQRPDPQERRVPRRGSPRTPRPTITRSWCSPLPCSSPTLFVALCSTCSPLKNGSRRAACSPDEPPILPDDFDLTTNQFYFPETDVFRVTYGSAEYAKDGLMPISEWLGPQTPSFARMTQMIDFIWENHFAGRSFQNQPIVQADPDSNSTSQRRSAWRNVAGPASIVLADRRPQISRVGRPTGRSLSAWQSPPNAQTHEPPPPRPRERSRLGPHRTLRDAVVYRSRKGGHVSRADLRHARPHPRGRT